MKKEERLNRLFGDIDDDLVADATARPIPLKVWLPRVTATVAAVALSVGLVLTQPWMTKQPPIENAITTPPFDTAQSTDTTGSNEDLTGSDPGENLPSTENGNHSTQTTTPVVSNSGTTQKSTTGKPTVSQPTVHTSTTGSTGNFIGGAPTTTAPTNNEVWYEPHWEDKPIWQQFPQFDRFEMGSYTVRDITIDKTMVEDYLENVNLHGYDIYTETGYDIVGKVYRIKGINPDCAVALQYPGRTDFFPATCSTYTPATLGQFITDLSLREHLRVGTVYHSYHDADGTYHDKEYAGLTTEKVWDLLLCDTSLPNVAGQSITWKHKISVRIDMPLLGYENISISLSENGYLRSNLLDTEKLFYIGEDKVDAFLAYVEENCRLQKDDELIPMPGNTNADTTTTSAAEIPIVTGTTVWKDPD